MRGQFWEVVQRLSATLPDQDPNNQPDAFPGDPLGRRLPLKEHVELRGYVDVLFDCGLPMFGVIHMFADVPAELENWKNIADILRC